MLVSSSLTGTEVSNYVNRLGMPYEAVSSKEYTDMYPKIYVDRSSPNDAEQYFGWFICWTENFLL